MRYHLRGKVRTACIAAVLLLGQAPVGALSVVPGEPTVAGFGSDVTGNGPADLRFTANTSGEVNLALAAGHPLLSGQTVAGGFQLLDLSFQVEFVADAAPTSLRARFSLRWSGLRAGARALGIRASSLRVMRLDAAQGRWARAVEQLRAGPRATRFLRDTDPDLVLGHHGLTSNNSLVWAVTDHSGGLFSIGGLPSNVPESASLLLAGGGFFTLLILGMGRERPDVAGETSVAS